MTWPKWSKRIKTQKYKHIHAQIQPLSYSLSFSPSHTNTRSEWGNNYCVKKKKNTSDQSTAQKSALGKKKKKKKRTRLPLKEEMCGFKSVPDACVTPRPHNTCCCCQRCIVWPARRWAYHIAFNLHPQFSLHVISEVYTLATNWGC